MEVNTQWKEINQEGRKENLHTIFCTLQYCRSKDEKITLKKIPKKKKKDSRENLFSIESSAIKFLPSYQTT